MYVKRDIFRHNIDNKPESAKPATNEIVFFKFLHQNKYHDSTSSRIHKNKMKKIILLACLIFLTLTTASGTQVIIQQSSTENVSSGLPEKIAHWKSKPDIKICTSAPVSVDEVKHAIAWWQKRGYRFGSIIKSNCVENHHYGFIVIDLIGQDFDIRRDLATTKIHHDTKSKEIRWAKIYLTISVRERILEHEIGHALGWGHSAIRKHILFPTWQGGGWEDEGLEVPALNLTKTKSESRKP